MLIQFIASYGHLHPEDYAGLMRGHGAPVTVSATWTGGSIDNSLAADLDCPICATMAMLGSSALPDGARLPLPPLQSAPLAIAVDALHLTPPAHLLFDTRGPPLS
ncbi:MAG TPA: hypothetical protein VGL83_07785 [Stellaceae bacterium]|jgi:hypothetical protein